jgi:hypothetical protein
MANVEFVDAAEMLPKRALRQSQRRQIQEEYDSYIRSLVSGRAGKVALEKGEKMSMVRDRLRSAAKRVGTPIQLRRKGGMLYFRLRDEARAETEGTDGAAPEGEAAGEGAVVEPAVVPMKGGRRRHSSA